MNYKREAISFRSTPAPRFRYSQCIRTGPFYEFAGMIGLTASGGLNDGGVAGEARQILKNLQAAMSEIGLSFSDMVAANIFTTRFDQFPEINKVWEEYFTADIVPPARTSIGVAALPLNATVEMSFRFCRSANE
jgi:2-iminobutanoate/2-iminopropanoate deaminase